MGFDDLNRASQFRSKESPVGAVSAELVEGNPEWDALSFHG